MKQATSCDDPEKSTLTQVSQLPLPATDLVKTIQSQLHTTLKDMPGVTDDATALSQEPATKLWYLLPPANPIPRQICQTPPSCKSLDNSDVPFIPSPPWILENNSNQEESSGYLSDIDDILRFEDPSRKK